MNKSFLIILVMLAVFISTGCSDSGYAVATKSTENPDEISDAAVQTKEIGVYVCGAVNDPGMYYFNDNARVQEAVNAAGGITAEGDLSSLNLAEYLKDCDKVYVPTYAESLSNTVNEASDGKVNINTASEDELMTLPGIGESKARSIIEYRNEHGGYSSIEEIQSISGIKEGVFQKIKDLIKV